MKFLEKRKFIHRPINRCEKVRTRQFAVQPKVGPQKKGTQVFRIFAHWEGWNERK